MKAYIEGIIPESKEVKLLFGFKLKATHTQLQISNAPMFPKIWKYNQLGTYNIAKPHNFKEGEWVEIEMVGNKIVKVKKV